MKQIQLVSKWTTLLFFAIAIFTMTIGQAIPIEFDNWRHTHILYDVILQGLPIAILLTLVWTINKRKSRRTNIIIGIVTPLLAAGMFFVTIFLMFIYGFGAWVDEQILYTHKENPGITINKQLWDIGAFGYGGQRTVKLTPMLGLWNWVESIDETKIELKNWTKVEPED